MRKIIKIIEGKPETDLECNRYYKNKNNDAYIYIMGFETSTGKALVQDATSVGSPILIENCNSEWIPCPADYFIKKLEQEKVK